MTNTITNVPRELLEVIEQTWRIHYRGGPVTTDIAADAIEKGLGQLRALLSAQSPAGVDGCKCSMSISMLGDGCRHCQPQEYIDRLSEMLDEERDQQAQRIGALEGLLREARLMTFVVNSGQSSVLRGQIDAALAELK